VTGLREREQRRARAAPAVSEQADLAAQGTGRPEHGRTLHPAQVVALQTSAGNRAVSRLLPARSRPAGGARLLRFDAGSGGHQGMEREVGGLDPHGGLGRPDNLAKPEGQPGTREAGVNAVYAGNFMQDFSQLKVPNFHKILSAVPKDPVALASGGKSETVGARGGEVIGNALIEALAVLEVGPRLAHDIVRTNMQNYRPEQHVDQPMGYSAATDALVTDTRTGDLRPGRRTVEGGGIGIAVETIDRDRDRELKGSAVPGIQMENPELLKISDAGLQNHIYNSVEWVKGHWLEAGRVGPTDQGRFHIGAGLHAIEDYFSHSNFIEVGLNGYIDRALAQRRRGGRQSAGLQQFLTRVQADEGGHALPSPQSVPGRPRQRTHVDTMFDASVRAPGGKGQRQAITSGSVGSNDLKASIGHILLPRIPDLQQAIDKGIDRMFHLVDEDKVSSWDQIKKLLGEDRPTAAIMTLGEGLDQAGVTLPVPDLELVYGRYIPIPFADDIDIPTDFKLTPRPTPLTQAISAYVGFVRQVRSTIATVREILDYIKYLGPIAYFAVKIVKELLNRLQELIKQKLEELRHEMKQQLNLFIVRMLDEISGVDVVDQKNRTIGDALHDAEDRVHEFEQRTSLEARLLPGGDLAGLTKDEVEAVVGPVEKAPGGGWKAKLALPPSHSEIAKDHAPPEEDIHLHEPGHDIRDIVGGGVHEIGDEDPAPLDPSKKPGADHDHLKGSIFYGLARALAVEADRHVMRQVELVWADRGSLYGDKGALDTGKMEIGHEAFGDEATKRAKAEEQRAARQKFKFAQSDAANQPLLAQRPALRKLLDLVDLIISHPDDSMWWRPVFDRYVDAHPEEVARHIRQRNRVRGERTRIPT
jgi:hypothetical protein